MGPVNRFPSRRCHEWRPHRDGARDHARASRGRMHHQNDGHTWRRHRSDGDVGNIQAQRAH